MYYIITHAKMHMPIQPTESAFYSLWEEISDSVVIGRVPLFCNLALNFHVKVVIREQVRLLIQIDRERFD